MKSNFASFCLLGLAALPLQAQVTVVPAPPVQAVPVDPVVEVVRPGIRVIDPVQAQRQLSVSPQVIVVPATPGSVTVTSPAPTLKTTKTTTVITTDGKPTRVYNSERSVVVVQEQGQSRELPYVTLPVLFVKETAELLDDQSRKALEQIAGVILAITKTEAGTLFDIEGHTSTDGTDTFNIELSAARAKRIYDELTLTYGVPPTALSAHGYGETFPMYPNGSEEQMQMDRRVLVVRTK
ncbi:MAG: OmpA family protein [Verrucomicrobiota bacterium]